MISLNLKVGLVSFLGSTCMFAVCLISPLQNIGGWFVLVLELGLGLEDPLITPAGCLDLDCWSVLLCRGVARCCLLAAGICTSSSDS